MINIQIVSRLKPLPAKELLIKWTTLALDEENKDAEITLRIVDEAEAKELNQNWRKQNSATNVLSFPVSERLAMAPNLLGDIVICAPIVVREAKQQRKTREAHWAHLVIHGALHLQGYDHQSQEEAAIMELKEINILKNNHYPNPYEY